MIRGLQLLVKQEDIEDTSNRCPVCGLGDGHLCSSHSELVTNFDKLREYINGLESVNSSILYILDLSIGHRKSLVINDVPIVNGRMIIREYLEERMSMRKCSEFMERTLKEILVLEKAKNMVLNLSMKEK